MWLGCACSRYRRYVCGSAVPAVGTGGMCVARLCLQYVQGYVCGSAVPAVGTGGMCVARLCLQ